MARSDSNGRVNRSGDPRTTQKGRANKVDPLKGLKIAEKHGGIATAKLYRAAIERALQLADQPHVGGYRTYRCPLDYFEELYHAEVDQKIRLILGKER